MNPNLAGRAIHSGVDAQNPWPGLVAFTEELKDFFHGRDEEAEELLRRVTRKNLTVLFGQSGLGKSSLLQAGLFPQLRAEGYLPIPIRLDHAASSPPLSEQVNASATRAILEAGGRCEPAAPGEGETLWEHFHNRGLSLRTSEGRPICPVLVFDQFEELFAIGQASEETRSRAATFLTDLADFVENRVPDALERRLEDSPELVKRFAFDDRDCRVLVCLREDYLPHLESLRHSMPSITENRMRLTRMDGARALEAVAIPGREIISRAVGAQVVRFVAGGGARLPDAAGNRKDDDGLADLEVEPSLLSLVCRELNNRRVDLGVAQITADLVAGNRERILQDFYDRSLADQPPAVRAFVEDELVTDSGLRENIALERAHKALIRRGAPASAIDDLVKRRLLHLEDRLDIQRVELTHDVLTAVVKKSRDERQSREAALHAKRKADADRERARIQRRRSRAIVAGMAVALAIVSGFGIWSYRLYRVSQDRLLEAQRQRIEAERQKDRAEKSEAAASLARKESDVVKEVFDDVSTPVTEEKVRHLVGLNPVHEELVKIRLKSLQLLAEKFPDDPTIELKMARAYALLGVIRIHVGSFHPAEDVLKTALELYGKLAKVHPDVLDYRLGECRALLELGFLYYDDNRKPAARHWYEKALARLDAEQARAPSDPEIAYEIGVGLNRMGGCLPEETTKEAREAFASRAVGLFEDLVKRKYREADSRSGLSIAKYRVVMARFDGKDQQGLLRSLDEIDALDAAALKLEPISPYLGSMGIFFHWDRADALVKLNRLAEALAESEVAVATARRIVERSPDLSRHGGLLSESLKKLAYDLRRVDREADARAAFEECLQVIDGLVRRYPDRAFLASQWVNFHNDLADFFENGPKAQGEIQARQDLLRTLDLTVKRGRELAARFPDHHWLQVNYAKTLDNRGRYDTQANQNESAFLCHNEGIEVYRTRIIADPEESSETDVNTYLDQLNRAAICASSISKGDEIIRLGHFALEVRSRTKNHDGLNDLGWILSKAATVHRDAGRIAEAVETLKQCIEVRRPAHESAPWHWYLQDNLGKDYLALADTYHLAKDPRNEVLALRDYLKLIIGPWWNTKIDADVDPARPTDQAEADRLRALMKTAIGPGMKNFTVAADFDGIKYYFTVYITNVTWPKHPLEDQARWIKEVRGGTIPKDVMDMFERLNTLAHDQKRTLWDVCDKTFVNTDNNKKLEIETLDKSSEATVTPEKSAADPLVELQARLVRLKAKLAESPGDLATMLEAAQPFEDFGQHRLKAGQAREGAEALREAVRLREALARLQPAVAEHRQRLIAALTLLGKAQVQFKDYAAASNSFVRRLDLLEQFQGGPSSPSQQGAIAETHMMFGELAEVRGERAEALNWYARAIEEDSADAATRLAILIRASVELADLLPPDLKTVYRRLVKGRTPSSLPAFVVNFPDAIKKASQVARLQQQAMHWHDLAASHEAKKQTKDYREALSKEYEIREQQRTLDDTLEDVKAAMVDSAVRLARSYREAKQMDDAALWTGRAADLSHSESLLQLLDWYEKGIKVKIDEKKADRYRYLGLYLRGKNALKDGKYPDALPDLIKVCQFKNADADDYNVLGVCYAKLGRWEEAIATYTRSIELDAKGDSTAGYIVIALEALIVAEKPDQLLALVEKVKEKGWTPPKTGPVAAKFTALYHGFRAMALKMSGKDASEAERSMREFTGKEGFAITGWSWDEFDRWFKGSKLAPDRKAAVENIVDELIPYHSRLVRAGDALRKGAYAEALPDLIKVCTSMKASADDHNRLGMCYGKLGRWDEAIAAYTRSIELDVKGDSASGNVLNALEALIVAEKPDQLLALVGKVKEKGWTLPKSGPEVDNYNALYHGFRSMALQMTGKDTSESLRAMREYTGKPGFKVTGWTWDEMDNWLKTTRLAPEKKAAVERILGELKGPTTH